MLSVVSPLYHSAFYIKDEPDPAIAFISSYDFYGDYPYILPWDWDSHDPSWEYVAPHFF